MQYKWYWDTETSNHMCGYKNLFVELDKKQRKDSILGTPYKYL